MGPKIRRATDSDVQDIVRIINHYAAQNIMLFRTPAQVRRVLEGFIVAEDEGHIVGCASLVELTPQLTEVRSLAVAPEYQGHGLGRQLVEELLRQADDAGYDQVCALTLRESFFNRLGFSTIDRWDLAPKVWHECIYCPKFHACDEIAVLMDLRQPVEARSTGRRRGQPVSSGQALWRRGLAWLASRI